MSSAGASRRSCKPKSPRSRKDPRDLTDKTLQKDSRQNIIHFLVEHRFPHEVSPKKLSGPTQKEFFTMVGFIIRLVDPTAPQELSNNTESMDYVIKFMKSCKYACMPAKSALQAVSSPVYWPSILGMLSWLVTYATYHIKRSRPHKGQDESSAQRHSEKHQKKLQRLALSSEGYLSYMMNNDDGAHYERLTRADFDRSMRETHEDKCALQQSIREKVALTRELEAQPDRCAEVDADIAKCHAQCAELKAGMEDFEERLVDTQHELVKLQELLHDEEGAAATMTEQIRAVKRQIETQPVSKAELSSMMAELESLRATKARALATKAERVDALKATQQTLERHIEDARKMVFEANRHMNNRKMVPAPGDDPQRFLLVLQEHASDVKSLLNTPDLEYAHWPRLKQIHQNAEQKAQHRTEEALQLRNKAASMRAANADAKKQLPALQAELAQLRAKLERETRELEAECSATLDEERRLRATAEEGRARVTQELADATAASEAALADAHAHAASKREESARIVKDLGIAVSVALQHINMTAKNSELFAKHISSLVQRLDKMEALAAPLFEACAAAEGGEEGAELQKQLSGLSLGEGENQGSAANAAQ